MMNKFTYAFAVFAASCAGAWATPGHAAERPQIGLPGFGPAKVSVADYAAPVAKNLKLISTTISMGQATSSGNDIQPVDDPVKIVCPETPAGKCVIEADMTVQLVGSADNTTVGVCGYFRNVAMQDPPCANQGKLANGEVKVFRNTQIQRNVSPGTRKVQTFFFANASAFGYYYSINYRVYKEK